ncbi:MAG: hypothetical protein ACOCV8_05695, partial [Spirochaetota bacterium]
MLTVNIKGLYNLKNGIVMDIKAGDKCIILPFNEKDDFKAYKSQIKNVDNNIIEIELNKRANISIGKNIIIELRDEYSLKRYKGTIRKTGSNSMLCVISSSTPKDRQYKRIDTLAGVSFRLWSEKNVKNNGLITNLSANGL